MLTDTANVQHILYSCNSKVRKKNTKMRIKHVKVYRSATAESIS